MGGTPANKGKGAGIRWIRENVGHQGDDCLFWPLSRNDSGYAILSHDGQRVKAHRYMCELIHGPAPSPEHHAAHLCGRGAGGCVNPRHLSWKTPKENMADSVRLGAVRQPGERKRYVLTEAQVASILAAKGVKTQQALADEFGVDRTTIGKIHRGDRWKDGPKKSPHGFQTHPWTRERRATYGR